MIKPSNNYYYYYISNKNKFYFRLDELILNGVDIYVYIFNIVVLLVVDTTYY
jgi:hypothetical protein